MTSLKLIAAATVIAGGGYAGILLSSAFSVRLRQLGQISDAIARIEFNIGFLHMNVSDSVKYAAELAKGTVNKIFMQTAEDIYNDGMKPSSAFERALRKYDDDLCLTANDKNIIREFAENFGAGDAESEINNIKATSAKLKLAVSEATEECERKGKLWRAVGILGGIFAVILLF